MDKQNLKRSSSSRSGSRSGTTGDYLGSTDSTDYKMSSKEYNWYTKLVKQDDARKKGGTKR